VETEEKYLIAQSQTTMETVQVIQSLAPIVAAARMFGVSESQAAVVMLTGHELGIGLAAAFQFVHVIDSKPSISPKGLLAMIHRSGLVDVKVTRLPEDKAKPLIGYECWMKRRSSGFGHTARFTLEDATRALLTEGSPTSGGKRGYGNWEKYPENMCMWRAIGFAADVVCPDLGGGMYRPEELGAVVDQDGEPVTIDAVAVTTLPNDDVTPTLQELVARYTAKAIMAANDGRIPATGDELIAIATKLGADDGSS